VAVHIGCGSSEQSDPRIGAFDAARAARKQLADLRPDLALVFVTGRHLDAAADTLKVVREVLQPRALAGGGSSAVFAAGNQLAENTSIVVWAASFEGGSAEVTYVPWYEQLPRPPSLSDASAVLLFPDYYSFPVRRWLPELVATGRGVPVLGGCVNARAASGGTVLFADDHAVASGMVTVVLRGVEVVPVVAEGQVPIGPELVISAADRNVVHEIAGRPAMEALQAALDSLTTGERSLLNGGINLGLVQMGRSPSWSTHKILSTDPDSGSITVGAVLPSGQGVRLLANSATFAAAQLRSRLELCRQALGAQEPAGILLFTCTSRDAAFFGSPGYDAAIASEVFRSELVSGFVSHGEIGPVGGGPRVLGLTTVAAVFPA
jgi:small ligand-binding sensory domain FIST